VGALAFGTLLGGIGLFLLGMSLMTDSLTALGGHALRGLLQRLAKRPFRAFMTGALATAILQSSSATTLITVGFVSAGLLGFAESLPLIFGANIGTTSTAWIVARVGLELDVGAVALPLVGVGALIRLVSRGRRARLGLALAGFGLVFVGIDVMQRGMELVDLDLTQWSGADGASGRILLLLVGAAMTVIMQSSSAAVATTIIALHAGTLSLPQAAALVIGQNVGTTVTAILGAAGGRLAAKRAAVAHTAFNVGTAIVALLLLDPFIAGVEAVGRRFHADDPETAIAIFHTGFNVLGVALFFPLTRRFAALVERVVPAREVAEVAAPSTAVLQVPALALEAARAGAATAAVAALELAADALERRVKSKDGNPWRRALTSLADPRHVLTGEDEATRVVVGRLKALDAAVEGVTSYLARIRTSGQPATLRDEHVELVHAVDHTRRLIRAIGDVQAMERIDEDDPLRRLVARAAEDLVAIAGRQGHDNSVHHLAATAALLDRACDDEKERRSAYRAIVLARIADGEIDPPDGDELLKASRRLGKVPKHAYRMFLHLSWTAGAAPVPMDEPDE
jgi:phosphate:Na+ symporter